MKETLQKISPVNSVFFEKAQKRLDNLTKPQGSLGRLEEFAGRLVAITENDMPELGKKVVFTFAGDHGVADEGVSLFPKEVTPQMVLNFLRGGAGINVLARHAGAEVVVVDMGVDFDFGDVSGLVSREGPQGYKKHEERPCHDQGRSGEMYQHRDRACNRICKKGISFVWHRGHGHRQYNSLSRHSRAS